MSKTVIITGGTSGIGQACAELYGSKGYNVVFTGRNAERLERTKNRMSNLGVRCLALECDVTSVSGAEEAIHQTIDQFGGVDVLICNAGVSMKALFEDTELHVFEQVLRVNLLGAANYVKYALPHIIRSKGSIIGISSVVGHRGTPGRTAYAASKFGMEGFFESLRLEVKHRGVHVMTVSPGYTQSGIRRNALSGSGQVVGETFLDEDKIMSAKKVAERIYLGQKKKKRMMVLTALGWWLTFFNKWIPSWMDRTVYRVMRKEDPELFRE